ncbi:MAG: ABC transporter ATP-binding protein [Candidatus Izemoplasma sp.]
MYVKIEDIEFFYTKGSQVLNKVSLDIEKGEIIALLGKSGSGKSTLLRIISGLEIPSKGFININGKILNDKNAFVNPEKRNVGMVFQDYALFPHMTISKNIGFGLSSLTKTEKEKRIYEMLELVNLESKANKYPYELSGGEQQRIALARSLATRPDLLLLDEPFSNLDSDLKHQIRDDLRKILNKAKITCLFVTHDLNDAISIADKTMEIDEGKIINIISKV